VKVFDDPQFYKEYEKLTGEEPRPAKGDVLEREILDIAGQQEVAELLKKIGGPRCFASAPVKRIFCRSKRRSEFFQGVAKIEMTDSIEAALRPIRNLLQADGFDLEVERLLTTALFL
jgi:hypothetical protein